MTRTLFSSLGKFKSKTVEEVPYTWTKVGYLPAYRITDVSTKGAVYFSTLDEALDYVEEA